MNEDLAKRIDDLFENPVARMRNEITLRLQEVAAKSNRNIKVRERYIRTPFNEFEYDIVFAPESWDSIITVTDPSFATEENGYKPKVVFEGAPLQVTAWLKTL